MSDNQSSGKHIIYILHTISTWIPQHCVLPTSSIEHNWMSTWWGNLYWDLCFTFSEWEDIRKAEYRPQELKNRTFVNQIIDRNWSFETHRVNITSVEANWLSPLMCSVFVHVLFMGFSFLVFFQRTSRQRQKYCRWMCHHVLRSRATCQEDLRTRSLSTSPRAHLLQVGIGGLFVRVRGKCLTEEFTFCVRTGTCSILV